MYIIDILGKRNKVKRENRQLLIERSLIDDDFLRDVSILTDITQDSHQELFLFRIEVGSGNKFPEFLHSFFSVNADEAGDVNSLFGAVEDVHKAHRKGLNDRAVSVKAVMDMKPEKPEWYTAIPGPEVKDIRSAISLNDRVMFITTLFRDDSMLFQDVVSKVNAMTSLDKVADYLTSTFPEWDMYSDMVYRFMMAVRRKLR